MKKLTKKQEGQLKTVEQIYIDANKNILFDLEGMISDIEPIVISVKLLERENKEVIDTVNQTVSKDVEVIKSALGPRFEHLVTVGENEDSRFIEIKNGGGLISITYRFQNECPELEYGIIEIDGNHYPRYGYDGARETWCSDMDMDWYNTIQSVFDDADITNTLKRIIKADLLK